MGKINWICGEKDGTLYAVALLGDITASKLNSKFHSKFGRGVPFQVGNSRCSLVNVKHDFCVYGKCSDENKVLIEEIKQRIEECLEDKGENDK